MKNTTTILREDLLNTPSHQRGTAHGTANLQPPLPGLTATQTQFRDRFAETANTGPWRGVYFDGPQPDQDHEGEEIPVWVVYVGDEEAEPVTTIYHVYDFARAQALAQSIAQDRRLELIHEATTA